MYILYVISVYSIGYTFQNEFFAFNVTFFWCAPILKAYFAYRGESKFVWWGFNGFQLGVFIPPPPIFFSIYNSFIEVLKWLRKEKSTLAILKIINIPTQRKQRTAKKNIRNFNKEKIGYRIKIIPCPLKILKYASNWFKKLKKNNKSLYHHSNR